VKEPGRRSRSRARKSPDDDRKSLSRLERILVLVPYCLRNPGVSLEELGKRFGVSIEDIIEDLNLVFMCGLPDYTPADLMDVSWEGGRVWIRMADYFSRPLRLTRSEAIPLYVKAKAILDFLESPSGRGIDTYPGVEELGSLRSALAKLGRALLPQDGSVAELTERIRVHLEAGEVRWLPLLRDAVTGRKTVGMEYYTYSRDTLTQRRVDPYLVFASLGHWYMNGYCHLARDRRIFRLDRIKSLEPTDEVFDLPDDAAAELPSPLLHLPGPEDATVRLRVSPRVSTWLDEFLPVETSEERARGWREITFHTYALPWLEKLLLRFGSDVVVIEPAELGQNVRASASRILALYGK
jgi:proteasome accessory factor C